MNTESLTRQVLARLDSNPETAAASQNGQGEEPSAVERVRSKLLTTEELRKIPPPTFLIDPILPRPGVALLFGPPGRGKTFLAAGWALNLGTDTPWEANGLYPVRPGLVVYVVAEGAHSLSPRVDAWEEWNQRPADGVLWYPEPVPLLSVAAVDVFAEAVAPHKPALIVFDTLARCTVGGDENSAKDMGIVVESLGFLARELCCTTLGVHHSRKDGTEYRGSSALLGAVDTAIELCADNGLVTIKCAKQKDSAPFSPVELELYEVRNSCVLRGVALRGAGLDRADDLLDLLCQVSATEAVPSGQLREIVEKDLNISRRSYFRLMNGLVEKGFAENRGTDKRAMYKPTAMGVAASSARSAK